MIRNLLLNERNYILLAMTCGVYGFIIGVNSGGNVPMNDKQKALGAKLWKDPYRESVSINQANSSRAGCYTGDPAADDNYEGAYRRSASSRAASKSGCNSLPLANLFDAIRQVESSNGKKLIGDGGASLGPYQISKIYWQDACEYGGLKWDYNKYVWSKPHCEKIMTLYWQRYGAKTFEDCARLHNGGPSKRGTDKYWAKVTKEIDNG